MNERHERPEEVTFPDAAAPQRLTAERLAAVHFLLSSKERVVARHDIVLATIFEFLEGGQKTTDEIIRYISQSWPGAHVQRNLIQASLDAAEAARLIVPEQRLGTTETWSLGELARAGLRDANDWGAAVVTRFETAIREEAARRIGSVKDADALRWAQILQDAVFNGVKQALTKNPRGVRVVAETVVFPEAYDLDAMKAEVDGGCDDDLVRDFLHTMLRTAMDPGHSLGSELVHHIATGYVLYAFVGRHDDTEARENAGSLSGEAAVLDTPCLFRMVGPPHMTSAMTETVILACELDVAVVVHADTIEEFEAALDKKEQDYATAIDRDLAAGRIDKESVVLADAVVQSWLASPPAPGKSYLPWSTFRERARQLPKTLQALGVEVTGHDDEVLHPGSLDPLLASMKRRLAERGTNGRHRHTIEHDARMLSAVAALRAANPPSDDKVWPGAFVVTTDSVVNAAYSDVHAGEHFPVALTPGQWASVLANCGDPIRVEKLAEAISRETSQETVLRRAAAVPVGTILQIARSLKGTDATRVDVNEMQVTLDELLAAQPDLMERATAEDIAQEVLARRSQRHSVAYQQHREAADEEGRRARAELDAQQREAAAKESALKDVNKDLVDRAERAETKAETAEQKVERLDRERRRTAGTLLLGFAVVLVLVVLAMSEAISSGAALLGGCGLVVYAWAAYEYCKDKSKTIVWLILAVLVVVVSVVAPEVLAEL
jgi:hypothetical protein